MIGRVASAILIFLAVAVSPARGFSPSGENPKTSASGVTAPAVERHWRLAREYLAKGLRAHAVAEARVVLRLDPSHAGAKALVESDGLSPVVSPTAPVTAGAVSASAKTPGMASVPNPAAQSSLVNEAIQAYRESRVDDARRLSDQVLAAEPANADAARILSDLGEEEYQPSPLGSNDVLKDLFGKAVALYRAGAWDEAAGVFQQALAVSPSHDQSRVFFGRCRTRAEGAKLDRSLAAGKEALAAGRLDEAKARLRNVLAIDPNHAEARQLLESVGAGPQAEERRKQAKGHFNKGVEAYEQGRWADAVREWELVGALDPSDEEAKKLLRKARGKDSAARKSARTRIPAMHEEAMRLYQQGKLDEAKARYRQILDLDPSDEKAKKSLDLIDGSAAP